MKYNKFPGILTNDSENDDPFRFKQHERELRKMYMVGVLHGINAQSMAQVKNDIMDFDDYGWEV